MPQTILPPNISLNLSWLHPGPTVAFASISTFHPTQPLSFGFATHDRKNLNLNHRPEQTPLFHVLLRHPNLLKYITLSGAVTFQTQGFFIPVRSISINARLVPLFASISYRLGTRPVHSLLFNGTRRRDVGYHRKLKSISLG